MKTELNFAKGTLTARVSGEIDHHTAALLREELDREIETRSIKKLVLDFEEVTFMDSSGIGLVMGRYRNLLKTGAELSIMGAPPNIAKMLKLGGIEKLAKIESR